MPRLRLAPMSAISKYRAGVISSILIRFAHVSEKWPDRPCSEMDGRRPVEADFSHLGDAASRDFRKAVSKCDRFPTGKI